MQDGICTTIRHLRWQIEQCVGVLQCDAVCVYVCMCVLVCVCVCVCCVYMCVQIEQCVDVV